MSTLCSVCNQYACPGCLGAAQDEIERLREHVADLKEKLTNAHGRIAKMRRTATEWAHLPLWKRLAYAGAYARKWLSESGQIDE
jgi:hypothetical protein